MARTKTPVSKEKRKRAYTFKPKRIDARIVAHIATSNDQVQEIIQERKAAKLMVGGKTFDQIGQELGISTNDAHELSKRIIRKWAGDLSLTANEVRELEVKRLDALVDILTQTAFPHDIIDKNTGLPIRGDDDEPLQTPPDLQAVKLLLDVADRRAKLLGIDAADKLKEKAVDMMTRKYIGGNPDEL